MGLNAITKTPCGFCFVEYFRSEHAWDALKLLSGLVCDGAVIRCELDAGFISGRQYKRVRPGNQNSEDRRLSNDPDRGISIHYDFEPPTDF